MNGPLPVLDAEELVVRRGGVKVLDIPLLRMREGEVVTVIGPNGAGKSTLLMTMACLLKPAGGRLFFRGSEVATSQERLSYRRRLAMVFQDPLLFDATVFDNVATGLRFRGLRGDELKGRVVACLERFRIQHLSERSARKLSVGEAQRTSLARAFATQPELIFLDEPFTALDPPSRTALAADLADVLRESRACALMATHEQAEAFRFAHRVLALSSGRIVQEGSPVEVISKPAEGFVASFVANLPAGAIFCSAGGK